MRDKEFVCVDESIWWKPVHRLLTLIFIAVVLPKTSIYFLARHVTGLFPLITWLKGNIYTCSAPSVGWYVTFVVSFCVIWYHMGNMIKIKGNIIYDNNFIYQQKWYYSFDEVKIPIVNSILENGQAFNFFEQVWTENFPRELGSSEFNLTIGGCLRDPFATMSASADFYNLWAIKIFFVMLSLVGTTNIFDVLVQNWSRIFPDNSPLSKHPKNSPYQTRKVNLDHNASFLHTIINMLL